MDVSQFTKVLESCLKSMRGVLSPERLRTAGLENARVVSSPVVRPSNGRGKTWVPVPAEMEYLSGLGVVNFMWKEVPE